MKYRRMTVGEVKPGDEVLVAGPDLLRVTFVEVARDAVCLHGHALAGDGFSQLPSTYTATSDEVVILVAQNVGLRVRMSEALKEKLGGECRKLGKHIGPFDSEEEDKVCYKCSWEHVQEFENSVGVIRGPSDYNNCKPGDEGYDPSKVGPEFDVYWEPDNLRYAYSLEDLEKAP